MTETETGPESLGALRRLASRAERRLRLNRALRAWGKALVLALGGAVVVLALRKVDVLGPRHEWLARALLLALLGATIVTAIVAYLRRLPERAGAVALDRHHGLADRLSSALAFGSLPASERTPFMNAAIVDARAHLPGVDPRRAVPLRPPEEWPWTLGLGSLLVVVALFEVRRHEPVVRAQTIDAVEVTADDVDAMREFLKEFENREQSEETKAAIQQFNQLIDDLARGRLDRTEAFRRMQALEDKLLEGREADKKGLEEALQKIGEELKKADLTKPAGEALENKNLAEAQKAMRELAKKLREQGSKIDKAKLDAMREALRKAVEERRKKGEELAKRREQLQQEILKMKQKLGDGGTSEEQSLLQKKQRELERLDRELQEHESGGRQLDRLDRELAQAAEDLMKDLGLSADDLEQGAEDLNRLAKQEMTDQEKEELRQKLQELRELLRRQGQGGQGQLVRLRRFQRHARGQSGQGQGEQEQGQGDAQGQRGEQGEGEGQGQGQQGQGGGKPGELWVLGPNGEKMLLITRGQGQGQGGGGGQDKQPGRGAGQGHDARVQGAATNPQMGTQDTQVAGQDTGQGGSRSEVILGAAERGFASRGYKRVFTEYHTVAEEALDKDEIPGGYRFYVRRYFQLIRPREDQK